MKIESITFEQILPIWQEFLWPNRDSAIEHFSCLEFGKHPYEYNTDFKYSSFIGLGIFDQGELIAVNSAHQTNDSLRSRGLYVTPNYRGCGLGKLLLEQTIQIGKDKNLEFTWSMPRKTSIKAYQAAGFGRTSVWFSTETSDSNCFVAYFNK